MHVLDGFSGWIEDSMHTKSRREAGYSGLGVNTRLERVLGTVANLANGLEDILGSGVGHYARHLKG